MPTYYTDKPGSFTKFKEKCLTAFKLTDQTEYLENKVAEARGELCMLIHLNDIALEKKFFEQDEEDRVFHQTLKMLELKETYEGLLKKAREWPGPEEVRNFMIQQLEVSLEHDVREPLPAREYSYENALDNALTTFKYYHESYNKHLAALEKYNDLIVRSQV